ncbi:hypothetical protein TRVA0_030S00782 [Trichomonascus vanleenenianus]|uniref:acyl-CoA thioesterase n=1 Tax=Trichomonascus vanleenenianus TaxID=2268995 RepID=UPI003ECA5F66
MLIANRQRIVAHIVGLARSFSSASHLAFRATSSVNNTTGGGAVQVLQARHTALQSDVEWIQDLLNKTEGGGYIVGNAGIFGQKVAWGDLDSFQHVNNVVYLKWFETARVNGFAKMAQDMPGIGFETFMDPVGVGPIMRSANIAWRYPITFPDTISVFHKLLPITEKDRFLLAGVVVSHNARKVACRITETIVTVDYDKGGIKAPIPDSIREGFNRILEEQAKFT